MVEIRFHKSTSNNYKEVIMHCRNFPSFQEGTPNVLAIPDANSLFSQWEEFNHIFHTAKRWAGFSLLFNGRPLAPYRILSEWFYNIQDIYYCYFRYYKPAYDKEGHCNDGGCWGCKRLKSVERYIQPSFWPLNYWYNYGHFETTSVWRINKQQIRLVLLEEATQKCLNFCPVFSDTMIEPHLSRLPDTITVDDVNWKVRYITDYLENGPVDIPDGIEPMEIERKAYPIVRDLQDEVIPFNFSPKPTKNPNHLTDEDVDRMIDEYLRNKNT